MSNIRTSRSSDPDSDENSIDAIFAGRSTSSNTIIQQQQDSAAKNSRPLQRQQLVVVENAKPTSHRDLPPMPADPEGTCSVLLFYQYVEPLWTSSQHKKALKKLMNICRDYHVTGRGRVAPEGMNCTLTGPPQGIRDVCRGLREYDKVFLETDFKITDGVPIAKQFKSLSVRKTEELVAYGLKGDAVAPSLSQFAGTHLEANQYHEALQDPDAVVVDVRNFYETQLGAFRPPKNGAKLIDPKLRNSVEFPRWLADPKTQEQFHNKKVLMYCTGGIRCERATALLNQMVAASQAKTSDDNDNNNDKNNINASNETQKPSADTITCKPKGVYELRGGIERYVKTFPEGGFWKGKNYLFDRRMEQLPEGRAPDEVEQEIDSKCCLCRSKWTVYRGQYSCSSKLCGVPVIVCTKCVPHANKYPNKLQCDLCREHYRPPVAQPDLVGFKRRAEEFVNTSESEEKKAKHHNGCEYYPDRLFVSRLPLTVTATKLKDVLLSSGSLRPVSHNKEDKSFQVQWLEDARTKAFYGSCIVQMPNAELANRAVTKAANYVNNDRKKGIIVDNKRIKISLVRKPDKDKTNLDVFSSNSFHPREYPPIVGAMQ